MPKAHMPNPDRPGYTKCGKSSFMKGLPTGGLCSICFSASSGSSAPTSLSSRLPTYTPPISTRSFSDELEASRKRFDKMRADSQAEFEKLMRDLEP